ncbi:MAG TPA: UPF0175 family protein [Bryobacteraceae bacterium]
MTIVVNLPDDVGRELSTREGDLSRLALESMALEGYRSRTLSEEQVRRMLGLDSRWDVHAFLKRHGVYLNYSFDEFNEDAVNNPGR